ncbi:hypothetical protein DdX_18510 [Ditylenchus destructor]|uniref:CCHC-type domain-containing protein n=1 Tax=Ditylenchus destructor TaxID=166010 RepID=A0AAD4MLF3_9BILA|nr:hypothetical protein DdX_18510 [Ditylenchus destructor]
MAQNKANVKPIMDGASSGTRDDFNELDIAIPDFPLKEFNDHTNVNFRHLKTYHGSMRKIVQDVNRAVRRLNRTDDQIIAHANNLEVKLANMCAEINLALKDLGLAKGLDFEANQSQIDDHDEIETARNGSDRDIFDEIVNSDDDEREAENVDQIINEEENEFIGMISGDSLSNGIGPYRGDVSISFARWSRRFSDYVDAMGDNWDEAKKLNKLKFLLEGLPRRYFDEIPAANRTSLTDVIDLLIQKIDGRKSRESALQELLGTRQNENESVLQFTSRLIPPVEVIMQGKGSDALNERLLDEFLGRINPKTVNLMRVGGFPTTFEEAVKRAQQIEPAGSNCFEPQRVAAINTDNQIVSTGNFRSWAPRKPDSGHINPRNGPINHRNGVNNNFRSPVRSDRSWSGRRICFLCRKPGHVQRDCREKRQYRSFEQRHQFNPGNRQVRFGQVNAVEMDQAYEKEAEMDSLRQRLAQLEAKSVPKDFCRTIQVGENYDTTSSEPEKDELPLRVSMNTKKWELPKAVKLGLAPKLGFLGLLSFMLLAAFSGAAPIPKHPLICPKIGEGALWNIPSSISCPEFVFNPNETVVRQTLKVYQPNMEEYVSTAWVCRKIRKRGQKKANWANNLEFRKLDPEHLPLSKTECEDMINHKKCLLGPLSPVGEFFKTQNKWDLLTNYWNFGWEDTVVDNCYLFSIQIASNFDELGVHSHSDMDTSSCEYQKGQCQLSDFTFLIWKPDFRQQCRYVDIGIWNGEKLGEAWLADGKEVGLTFYKDSKPVFDCGQELEISIQGLAAKTTYRRNKRYTKNRQLDGNVRSTQEAARLTYLSADVSRGITHSFQHALQFFCEMIEVERENVINLGLSNPTLLARTLFDNPNLTAEYIGARTLRIWPCIQLEAGTYHFQGTNSTDECYEHAPLGIHTDDDLEFVFLDPKTMITSKNSQKGHCEQLRNIAVEIDGVLMNLDQVSGRLHKLNVQVFSKHWENRSRIQSYQPHAFHTLILTNISKTLTHSYFEGLAKTTRINYRIEKDGDGMKTSPAKDTIDIGQVLGNVIKSRLEDAWWWWITACGIIVSIFALFWILICFLNPCLGTASLFNTVSGVLRKRMKRKDRDLQYRMTDLESKISTSSSTNEPKAVSVTLPPEASSPAPTRKIKLVKFQPEVQFRTRTLSVRKAKVKQNHEKMEPQLISPIFGGSDDLNRPVVKITINGNILKAAIDHWADSSIITECLAKGIDFVKQNPATLTTFNGSETSTIGEAFALVNIENLYQFRAHFLVINNTDFVGNGYDIILGRNCLGKLPPITFDLQNNILRMGKLEFFISGPSAGEVARNMFAKPPVKVDVKIGNNFYRALADYKSSFSYARSSLIFKLHSSTFRANENEAPTSAELSKHILGYLTERVILGSYEIDVDFKVPTYQQCVLIVPAPETMPFVEWFIRESAIVGRELKDTHYQVELVDSLQLTGGGYQCIPEEFDTLRMTLTSFELITENVNVFYEIRITVVGREQRVSKRPRPITTDQPDTEGPLVVRIEHTASTSGNSGSNGPEVKATFELLGPINNKDDILSKITPLPQHCWKLLINVTSDSERYSDIFFPTANHFHDNWKEDQNLSKIELAFLKNYDYNIVIPFTEPVAQQTIGMTDEVVKSYTQYRHTCHILPQINMYVSFLIRHSLKIALNIPGGDTQQNRVMLNEVVQSMATVLSERQPSVVVRQNSGEILCRQSWRKNGIEQRAELQIIVTLQEISKKKTHQLKFKTTDKSQPHKELKQLSDFMLIVRQNLKNGDQNVSFQRVVPSKSQNKTEASHKVLAIDKAVHSTVTILAESVRIKALIDTGSTLTLAHSSLSQTLNLEPELIDYGALSASGHRINILGIINVNIAICDLQSRIKVYLTDSDSFLQTESYQIILGVDTLRKMPWVALNYTEGRLALLKTLSIGKHSAKLGRCSGAARVHALETMVIQPETQVIMQAQISKLDSLDADTVVITNVDLRLANLGLDILPSFSQVERNMIQFLISNTTRAPVQIFKGMTVAQAQKVVKQGNCLTEILDKSGSEDNQEVVNAVCLDPDPTYKIDWSQSVVQGQELEKLQQLTNEFSDVFSRNSYDIGSSDTLSRLAEWVPGERIEDIKEMPDIVEAPVCLAIKNQKTDIHNIHAIIHRGEDDNNYSISLTDEQQSDHDCKRIIDYLSDNTIPAHISENDIDSFKQFAAQFEILDNVLYFKQEGGKEKDFDEFLPYVNFCYNTAVHSTTNETPFYLLFGRQPIFAIDQILDPKTRDPIPFTDTDEFKVALVKNLRFAWAIAAEETIKAQERNKIQISTQSLTQTMSHAFTMMDGRKGMAFLSARSFLSNFYTAEEGLFTLDGINFVSTEQYYQMEKARFANQDKIGQEIMTSVNPLR